MRRSPVQNTRNTRSRKDNPPRSPLGGLLVLVVILGIVLGILAFKDQLKAFLPGETAAQPVVKPSTPQPPLTTPEDTEAVEAPPVVETPKTVPKESDKNVLVVEGTQTPAPPATTVTKPEAGTKPTKTETPPAVPVKVTKPVIEDSRKKVALYWVRVSDDSVIHLEKVSRTIQTGESPLTSTINTILKGPNTDDLNGGFQSVIPAGTKLLSAYIQKGTAYLNFSEEFQYNPTGAEGARAQLRQIVWTATEFDSVTAVQILIEGKKVPFLGGDGIAVGKPLSRSSF